MNFQTLEPKIIQMAEVNSDVEILWLYGSYAKGTAHSNSDIDLAISFDGWIEDPVARRLQPELLALEWLDTLGLQEGELSILDINNAAIPLAMSVLKSGKLLLSKNSSRQLQVQQRIMSKWEIDFLYHYHYQHQQAICG